MKKIIGPLTKDKIKSLIHADEVAYTGLLYTARDQAHKRLVEIINKRQKLPLEIQGKIIYYCGPNPAPKGRVIGSCGPTTSSRMDEFTPVLLKAGLSGMVGKGERSKETAAAIKKYGAVYFVTHAGCGALLSKYVKDKKLVCFKELKAEAVYELKVVDFPLIVAIDARGGNIYE